ncbi:60S ribosomal protein L14, putative [Eimeria mitis]|uniref:60S ribosomal protein L14, putative n=1 Tax=Eimeria mitis TaxID=44415 RepID=U6K4C3_9EIME|nr:60S ribosomal protein L14, putative [Eimeria mitis]CDJ30603.1 60S ribosomal protein L14, putative [Eimeria mitis]
MALFQRFIEPGRLCVVQYGPDEGKLCFVVDIINLNRVLVDGAGVTGVKRQSIPIRRVALTDMRLKIPHGVRSVTLRKALEKDDVIKKFNETAWGKRRIAKQRRAALTDFERFKLMVARKQRAQAVRSKLSKRK